MAAMARSELLDIVADQERQSAAGAEFVAREVLPGLVKRARSPQVVIITGVRRCGKSVLLGQVQRRLGTVGCRLSFDDDRLVRFSAGDFQALLELFIERYGEQHHYFFDEIQNVAGWERFVRRLQDQGHKIWLTGSNATLLSRELGTHLTGRHTRCELFPFSFREFLKLRKVSTDSAGSRARGGLKRQFAAFQREGGFPEYLRTGEPDYLRLLYEGLIYRDILVRYRLPQERPLKELAWYLAGNVGRELSFNRLKNLLQFGNATTVADYIGYLENAYLLFIVKRYQKSPGKQLRGGKKVYAIDSALARQTGFRATEETGRMLENTVFLEFRRRGREVYYHQGKAECDFIVVRNGRAIEAVQVCLSLSRPDTREREVRGLAEACAEHGLKHGLIITEDETEEFVIGTGRARIAVRVIPAWRWLLTGE